MSVNDIMNYVNKTPGNTNPAVIKSMVESEKNKAVYESVEDLKKSGGVGYAEVETEKIEVFPQTTLNYLLGATNPMPQIDIITGKEYVVIFEGVEYKSKAYDFIQTWPWGDIEYIALGNCSIYSTASPNTGEPFLCLQDESGVTFYAYEGDELEILHTIEIYHIEETEIIHPVDPKFLPAMDSITLNGADGKLYELRVDEAGKLSVSIKDSKLISFTIMDYNGADLTEYTAEKDMTWEQWIDSEYNAPWCPSGAAAGTYYVVSQYGKLDLMNADRNTSPGFIVYENDDQVKPTDIILPSGVYKNYPF